MCYIIRMVTLLNSAIQLMLLLAGNITYISGKFSGIHGIPFYSSLKGFLQFEIEDKGGQR